LLDQAIHVLAARQIGRDRPRPQLRRQRLEQLTPPAAQDQLRAVRRERAGDGMTDPAAGSGQQHGPRESRHEPRGKTARVAVKPWRKLRPPTGPISPAAKKPAVGAPPSSRSIASASWSAMPNIALPRPLHENTTAPAGGSPASAATLSLSA